MTSTSPLLSQVQPKVNHLTVSSLLSKQFKFTWRRSNLLNKLKSLFNVLPPASSVLWCDWHLPMRDSTLFSPGNISIYRQVTRQHTDLKFLWRNANPFMENPSCSARFNKLIQQRLDPANFSQRVGDNNNQHGAIHGSKVVKRHTSSTLARRFRYASTTSSQSMRGGVWWWLVETSDAAS